MISRLIHVVVPAALLFGLTACGGDEGVPDEPPTGPDFRTIHWECSIESHQDGFLVEVADVDALVDIVSANPFCTGFGELVEVWVELPCPQGLRTITVAATNNAITSEAALEACERAS